MRLIGHRFFKFLQIQVVSIGAIVEFRYVCLRTLAALESSAHGTKVCDGT